MSMVVYLRRTTAEEIERLASAPDLRDEILFGQQNDDLLIDFDKAWHALHFMLTGDSGRSEHPLSILVTDDAHLIGTDSHGLGGYWLFEPERVRSFAGALAALSDEGLAQRYDPSAMVANHIYLSDLFEEEGADALPYVLQRVPKLRDFAREAADADNYIVAVLG